jgi:putative SOS response-associated peptidase YedK
MLLLLLSAARRALSTMCSRYSLTSPPEAVRQLFGCEPGGDDFPPRYNVAPTDPVHIVRRGRDGKRVLELVRWGLIPGWVKDPRDFATLINARAETVADKPSFRGAFRYRRCLVPTDGFYEWTGPAGAKQPHLIRMASRELFAFAGLWETWLGSDGSEIDTMAIVTTSANGDMARIHDRMPVILPADAYALWLDAADPPLDALKGLLRPLEDGLLEIIAVSWKLNNPRAEGAELQEPVTATLS